MDRGQIHFEVFVRRNTSAGWTLDIATEDRRRAIDHAESLLSEGRVAAIRVTRETLDTGTGEYHSFTLLSKGAVTPAKAPKVRREDDAPLCVSPADLYTVHAREKIARLLEGWLKRNQVTPFELLHRPDLVEQLEASGTEVQHAIQRIAIPEAQARGVSTHEVIRAFQKLADRAIERVIHDGRKRVFPSIAPREFASAVASLADDPDRVYRLGGAVSGSIATGKSWREKIGLILDLADAAPEPGQGRKLAFEVLQHPLAEILGSNAGVSELAGESSEYGDLLGTLTRLVAAQEIAGLAKMERGFADYFPPLSGEAARLAAWLERSEFESVRKALARRLLKELKGPRRLRPGDPVTEIATLRAMAMALTASAGRILTLEEVQEAFTERSKSLVTPDFVGSYVGNVASASEQANLLVRLAENTVGMANKRAAARWISGAVAAQRFEQEFRRGGESPAQKLSKLAELQRAVCRIGLGEADQTAICERIGAVGGLVEADASLVGSLVKASAAISQRILLLLTLASGEAAPLGPASDRAKAEVVKLVRLPEVRTELAAAPETFQRVKQLMGAAGLAA